MYFGVDDKFLKELITFCYKSGKKTHHITRLYMYKALSNKLAHVDFKARKCLALSSSIPLGQILGLKNCLFDEANFPEYDILNLSHESGYYDFCVSDQVLEHIVGDPFVAFKETVRVVKKGGFVCHTTCFTNPIHKIPHDLWRFAPDALKLLAETSGCRIVEVGGWGNQEFWTLDRLGVRMDGVPDDPENPIYKLAMRNDPSWPVVTWVIAEKL